MPFWTNALLTTHAKARLAERSKMHEEELLDQLNNGNVGIKLGVSKETNLAHRLVWSEADNNHIVIIQDVINGSVLTVLTIEMYKRDYSDRVNDIYIAEAKAQIINRKRKLANQQRKISITGMFKSNDGKLYAKTIGKWKDNISTDEIESLGRNEFFWVWVMGNIQKKELPLDNLKYITAGYSMTDRVRIEYTVESE